MSIKINAVSSCTLYIVLFSVLFTINVGIAMFQLLLYFVYNKYMNRNEENVSKYDFVYQAKKD